MKSRAKHRSEPVQQPVRPVEGIEEVDVRFPDTELDVVLVSPKQKSWDDSVVCPHLCPTCKRGCGIQLRGHTGRCVCSNMHLWTPQGKKFHIPGRDIPVGR